MFPAELGAAMDSVTQFTLGAAVGEACLGRKIGNKAALWGGVVATLPDLDNFIPYQDAVASVTYHRSFSHSLIVLSLLTPIVARLMMGLTRSPADLRARWYWMVFLALTTHALLDAFTVYGTQLLWPLLEHPFSGSSIFIIDPAYTLPLLLGVLAALFLGRERSLRIYLNAGGLALSTLYLVWTVAAKFQVEKLASRAMAVQGLEGGKLLSTPAPFTSFLWRLVLMGDEGYYVGYYSVLSSSQDIEFRYYPDDKSLLGGLEEHWPVQRLAWFTHGFYAVNRFEGAVVISDLRMGIEPAYAFNFRVAEILGEEVRPVISEQFSIPWRQEQLQSLWQEAAGG